MRRKAAYYLEMCRTDWSNLCALSKNELIASIAATTSASGSREFWPATACSWASSRQAVRSAKIFVRRLEADLLAFAIPTDTRHFVSQVQTQLFLPRDYSAGLWSLFEHW